MQANLQKPPVSSPLVSQSRQKRLTLSASLIKQGILILSSLLIFAPFILCAITESAIPLLLLGIYPATIFVSYMWRSSRLPFNYAVSRKVCAVISIFGIYKLNEFVLTDKLQFGYALPMLVAPALLLMLAGLLPKSASSAQLNSPA